MDASNESIPKSLTGIYGLDEILNGGLPSGALTLLSGGPGTGKTLLGMEFLYNGALNGVPGILLSFEESFEIIKRNTRTLGWQLQELEDEGLLSFINAKMDPQAVMTGNFDLSAILAILAKKAKDIGAKRLLIDGPDVFLRLLNNAVKERMELYRLNEWSFRNKLTTIVTMKSKSQNGQSHRYEFMDYLSDCVIYLDQRVEEQVATRRLRVIKYRGSNFGRNEYPFAIYRDGLYMIPVSTTELSHHALGESVSSGVEKLDEILGGGMRRNSCNLISGTSGTGKTTLACSFIRSLTENNEKVLYLNFEESREAVTSGMQSAGIDLQPAVDNKKLFIDSVLPESLGVEEHLIRAFSRLEETKCSFIVVDAISACRRMGSQKAAFDYLLRLIDYCKKRGITSFLTNLTSHASAANEITGIDLSSVIDTVILLRNVEEKGELHRVLLVLKSRGRFHSNKCHGFRITDNGIKIGDAFIGHLHG